MARSRRERARVVKKHRALTAASSAKRGRTTKQKNIALRRGGGGGGGSAFEKLAAGRGVDLEAEKKRAKAQLKGGRTIQGTAKANDKSILSKIGDFLSKDVEGLPAGTAKGAAPIGGITGIKGAAVGAAKIGREGIEAIAKAKATFKKARAAGDSIETALQAGRLAADKVKQAAAVSREMAAQIKAAKEVASTVVSKLKRIGTTGKTATAPTNTVATNTKTLEQTSSWLGKIVKKHKKKINTGLILAAIGSYPFSMYVKSEALQAIKGTYTGAMIGGDMEQAQLAIDERNDILDPSVWEDILSIIPIANTVKQLKDYFDTAKVAVAIDQTLLDNEIERIENGETDQQYWDRVRADEAAQDKASVDYFNEQALITHQLKIEADKAADKVKSEQIREGRGEARAEEIKARNEDAAFWARERAKIRQEEAKDRKAIADFWAAYRKEAYKIQQDSRPSNLNFGLL